MSALALPHPAMASNTVPQSFSRPYIRSTLLFLFPPGYTLQKASTASFTLSWGSNLGGNLIFTSSPALHVFHAVKQIRNNRISSADCEAFSYFTISVYRFDSDFHLPSIPLRPLPFHQEAVWPLHSLLQALRKYLHTLQKHGLSDIPILVPFDLLFSHF